MSFPRGHVTPHVIPSVVEGSPCVGKILVHATCRRSLADARDDVGFYSRNSASQNNKLKIVPLYALDDGSFTIFVQPTDF